MVSTKIRTKTKNQNQKQNTKASSESNSKDNDTNQVVSELKSLIKELGMDTHVHHQSSENDNMHKSQQQISKESKKKQGKPRNKQKKTANQIDEHAKKEVVKSNVVSKKKDNKQKNDDIKDMSTKKNKDKNNNKEQHQEHKEASQPKSKGPNKESTTTKQTKETKQAPQKITFSLSEDEEDPATQDVQQTENNKSAIEAILKKPTDASVGKKKEQLVHPPVAQWWTVAPKVTEPVSMSAGKLARLQKEAAALLERELNLYQTLRVSSHSSSDRDFIATVLRSGTTSDKLSTLTLLVHESPLHALNHLHNLIGMAKKKSRTQALLAVDAIRELCTSVVLPDRKLKFFVDQAFPATPSEHLLILYEFEHQLKTLYFTFLQTLEPLVHDALVHIRTRTLTYISDLLIKKPEGEHNLLLLLVNKLGDTDRKVASRSSYLITKLVESHPMMKKVVVREVRGLIFKPAVTEKTIYYALVGVNQMILTKKEEEAARALVELYLDVFKMMMVNATKPRKSNDDKTKKSHDTKSKELSQQTEKDEKEQDKDMVDDTSLNSKLLAALLTGLTRAYPFSAYSPESVSEHVEILFRLTHFHTGSFMTSLMALRVIWQVCSGGGIVSDRFYRTLYSTLTPPSVNNLLASPKSHSLFLHLIYISLSHDDSLPRIHAFIKRLLQACSMAEVGFIAGVLGVVGKLAKEKKGVWTAVSIAEGGDDEEERFDDLDEEKKVEQEQREEEDGEGLKKENEQDTQEKKSDEDKFRYVYDGRKRDPQYCGAEKTCFWELVALASHYHPTVSLYAKTLLSSKAPEFPSTYDPLTHHSLSRFLDKFTHKNPKNNITTRGSSIMQPSKQVDDNLMQDDEVFKKFMDEMDALKGRTKKSKKMQKAEMDEEGEGMDELVDEEELSDDEVWKAMQQSSGFPVTDEDGLDDEEMDMLDQMSDEDSDADANEENEENEEQLDEDMLKEMDGFEDIVIDGENLEEVPEISSEEDVAEEMEDGDDDVDESVMMEDADSMDEEDEDDAALLEAALMDSDAEEDETTQSKKNGRKVALEKPSKSKLSKMALKAKALGYKGAFFNTKKNKDDELDADLDGGIFASADDFGALVDMEEEEDISNTQKEGMKQKKRKREVDHALSKKKGVKKTRK